MQIALNFAINQNIDKIISKILLLGKHGYIIQTIINGQMILAKIGGTK